MSRAKRRKILEVLDHPVDAADEVAYLGASGLVNMPSEVPLLELKRLGRKKIGDEVLHHQLIICIRLRPSLSSLLFERSQGFSDEPVPRHTKLLGSCEQVLAPDDLVENCDKLE